MRIKNPNHEPVAFKVRDSRAPPAPLAESTETDIAPFVGQDDSAQAVGTPSTEIYLSY